MRTALPTFLAVLAAGLAHGAPGMPSGNSVQERDQQTAESNQGQIHLLRRSSTRKAGVPLHEHLNNEKARLLSKHRQGRAKVAKRQQQEADAARGIVKRDDAEEPVMEKRAGSAQFGDQTNTLYYAAVTVGTPAKSFPVGIDSGSSDLWISGENWKGASVSSTFQKNGNEFTVSYEDGTGASGYQGTDKVSFAGYSATTALSVGTNLSQNAAPAPADGIFGFGWPALATAQEKPFWITSGANVFAMYLASTNDFNNNYAYGGVISLGAPDSTYYSGSINYVSITEQIYWTVKLGGVSVGGNSLSLGSNQEAVIDSGTSLIGAPNNVVQQFYSGIPNAQPVSGSSGFYEYPCSNSNLGISFTFGGQSYAIPDDNFIFETDQNNYCVGALFENGDDGSSSSSQFIVGDSFMRGVYTVFDGPRNAVGFASLSSSAPTSGPNFNVNSGGSNSGNSGNSGNNGNGNGGGNSGAPASLAPALSVVFAATLGGMVLGLASLW
ncbi:hypothetical protein OC845_000742 [Tilletia horrida]|nr:hypothetical protein OC845_000742 [Tilletia horrida]